MEFLFDGFEISMDERTRYGDGGMWGRAFDAGPLTDKRIAGYAKRGFYSTEAKAARAEWRNRHFKRKGNFVEAEDGRLIYSPL